MKATLMMSRDMFTITRDFTFSAAHSLRGHTGGCENLHGHNYRLRVTLKTDHLNTMGMVMDFKDLGAIIRDLAAPFDHGFLNEIPPFDGMNATAENMAKYFFDRLSERVKESGCAVHSVEIYETDHSSASYTKSV